MRRITFALLVAACICATFAIVQAAHKGISELHPRTYTVFRDPSDGSVISSGSVKCYEAEWDTAAANGAGYAWKFTRTGSGTASYFYYDDMPYTNCLTCYWRDGATVVCCAESLQFEGKALADSAVTAWTQIKENVITRANMLAGENWAWHTEIADSCFLLSADTLWASQSSIATHSWVEGQGYGGSGSFNMQSGADSIFGSASHFAQGTHTGLTFDYSYGGSQVDLYIGDNQIRTNMIHSADIQPLHLKWNIVPAQWDIVTYYSATELIPYTPSQLIEAGDDLTWSSSHRIDYTGSAGSLTEEQVEDYVGTMVTGNTETGIEVTYEDGAGSGDGTLDFVVGSVTGEMITDGSIRPPDLAIGGTGAIFDIPVYGSVHTLSWQPLNAVRDHAPEKEDFQDDVAALVEYDAAGGGGIDVVYDDPGNAMDYTVYIDYTHIEDQAVRPDAINDMNSPSIGDVAVVHSLGTQKWQWLALTSMLEGGTGLTISTGSTASTCSLNVDFSMVDWPASVSTIQILTADIWRAEIDTLEAGRVTADSLTMLGTRWDDGAGKLLAAVLPDSVDFSSISTVALYVNGTRAVERFVELADSTVKAGGYTTQQWVEDNAMGGEFTFDDQAATPSTVATLLYNNNAKGLMDGALCWWDDDEVRYLVDLDVLPVDDDYVVAYDAAADNFYMKADAGAGAAGTVTTVKEAGVQVGGADIVTLDFGAGFDVAEDPNTEINFTIDLTEIAGAFGAQNITTTGQVTTGTASASTALYVTSTRWDNASGKIDGEQIADDTIDDDSIDLVDITLADFTDDISNTVDTEWDSSSEIAAAVADETGSGLLTFATSPRFTTQIDVIGTASVSTALVVPLIDANGAALALGDGDETVAINSSDWAIDATGIATGFGNFTSNGTIEGATLTEGGTAVYNTTESDAAYQPLDDTLTDIADETINANLINTAHPWADNEVADILTLSTVSGAVDMASATSVKIPTGNDPATTAEGHIAWDWNDDALEVYSGDEAESVLIPMYQVKDFNIFAPDGVADEIYIFHVDALVYPHGIELDQLSITLSADAAYSMVFEEWAGDPPVYQNDIETVTTGANDAYKEDNGIDDAVIDADDYIFLHIPATDVDWVAGQLIFHVTEGN